MIRDEVKPLHHLQLEPGYKVWKDRGICISKKIIPVEKEILEEWVQQSLLELT